MIATFQGLLVAVLALLPGASYNLRAGAGHHRLRGQLRRSLVRFLAASAVIHALFAGSEYQLYRCLIAEHRLANGTANVWLLQGLALGYVLLPTAIGSAIGWGHKRHHKWSILLVGAAPEPCAWDYLWRHTRPRSRPESTSGSSPRGSPKPRPDALKPKPASPRSRRSSD